MMRRNVWITLALLCQSLYGAGQNTVYEDSIPFGRNFSFLELNAHFPFGQCFLKRKDGAGATRFRAVLPNENVFPKVELDSMGKKMLANLTFTDPSTQRVESKVSQQDENGRSTVYSYKITSSTAIKEADKYFWEISPDPTVPLALSLNLGYGSSRLDLSDLSLRYLNLYAGASDVILTYTQPNRGHTKAMNVSGGMSRIVLRNPEYAHAELVRIVNGMGNTKIVLGDYAKVPTEYQIEVNAGALILIADENAPVRIILENTFLSAIEIPESFFNSAPNTYENLAAKRSPEKCSTFFIDLGLGRFSLLSISKLSSHE